MVDIIIAGALLVLVFPLIALVAIAVRLDSAGPALFRQRRVGYLGRAVTITKFRTMVVDAEERREALLAHSDDPDWLKLERDPRVTRVGRTLRSTSLDELPQLWDVVRGDLSLVGPRPLIPEEASRLSGPQRLRATVKPGITGLWQVSGRTELSFQEMVELDCCYVRRWSLAEDIRLLCLTVPAVLARGG